VSEDPREPPPLAPPADDQDERARCLRPQPPAEIPARATTYALPGLLARSLLGDRVIK